MRLFLALELQPPVGEALEEAIAPLRAAAPELCWVPPAKRHLTLKFLGDVPHARVGEVTAMTDAIARGHHPFEMELGGVGAFPNFRRARVVWSGVAHEPRLELLHHDLEVAGDAVGFELEGRAFRPHVTLARVRTAAEVDHVRRLARAARRVDFTAAQDIDTITLFESTLAPAGAPYRRVHVATLGGG
ncbi:MAG: RNA 2',3'-cyclic phosphodiesterase [bacterium]